MSLMLGPIHNWLFNKIQIAEERANILAAILADAGTPVDDLVQRYGEPLAGKDLATLVGNNSIHQYLQGLITRVQIFEASLVERSGDRLDLLMKEAERHGADVAARLVPTDSAPLTADDIARLLNDTQLEGMPCDPPATFTPLASGEGFAYTHSACNHRENWSYTGVDLVTMCRLNNQWIKGFVTRLGGEYSVSATLVEGADGCKAQVTRKG